MVLSPKVARPAEKSTPDGKPVRRRSSDPFSSLNQRDAGLRRQPRDPSLAEQKRSSRGKDRTQGEKGSQGTFKALRMQRALATVPYGHRNTVKERIRSSQTFDEFPLLSMIKSSVETQALPGLDEVTPTPIQRLAIPALLGVQKGSTRRRSPVIKSEAMEQFLLAAETGSGKTLAYLLPILNAIKKAEAADADIEAHSLATKQESEKPNDYLELEPPPRSNLPHPTTGRPRAIILVPTAELVAQVGSVAKALSHSVKFRAALLSSAYTGRVIRNRLFAPTGIDVVISTPHLLSSIAESDPNILSRVSHLVIDEADSLLDRSFAPSTSEIIDKATPSLRQLVLCSATIPRSLDRYIWKRFPDINRLVTPNLHAIPRRVQLGVIDVDKDPYRGNRNLACADTIWSIGKLGAEQATDQNGDVGLERLDVKHILVFVNERETTQEVADFLVSKGIDAVALNRDTPELRQSDTLSAFTSTAGKHVSVVAQQPTSQSGNLHYSPANRSPKPLAVPGRSLPNTKVLVSTDLGSRGIDTVAVRHVILYDVPHSTIDFIHRLGRTGRMGRRGRGIVLVGKKDRKDVVREVREGMYKGQALI
ncbi:MAG: RNA helicase [Heterodermia speciosa]|uniref:RNA helicase n=1 Tax=Heterodermia speciosa TaxID=116794 RepID=A0A8H3F094_9LECA|nr:MAG: RNA helicase [Heterodermia speciosa]